MNKQDLAVGDKVRVMWASKWQDGEVAVIHNGEPVIVFGCGFDIYQPAKYFTAIEARLSEEDKAVEEMFGVFNDGIMMSIRDRLRNLYRAGYRNH